MATEDRKFDIIINVITGWLLFMTGYYSDKNKKRCPMI